MATSTKDYVAIAKIINTDYMFEKAWGTRAAARAIETLANKMADYFASQNERFDRNHFMDACGMKNNG